MSIARIASGLGLTSSFLLAVIYGRHVVDGIDQLRRANGAGFFDLLVLSWMVGSALLVLGHAACFLRWFRRSRMDWPGILVAAGTLGCALLFSGGRVILGVLFLPWVFFGTESSGMWRAAELWLSNGLVAMGWGTIAVLSLAQCLVGLADWWWLQSGDPRAVPPVGVQAS
jgi:hypothetical protein